MNKIDVLGVGAAIVDNIIEVEESYLDQIPGEKWGAEPVDHESLIKIIEESGKVPSQIVGGSCANAIKGLSRLGRKCALTGRVGADAPGRMVQEDLEKNGVKVHFINSTTPTGGVVSMIVPDGRRTLRCYTGASQEMVGEDMDRELFESAEWVHIEGYTLLMHPLTEKVMQLAKETNTKVSFDLASFELVEAFHDKIVHYLKQYVNVVFCNADEASALAHRSEKNACEWMKKLVDVAVVMMGAEGCWVGSGDLLEQYPAIPVKPIDTTGAGDLFASGFMHGYLGGKKLRECARYGAIVAKEVVQVVGTEIPDERWETILKEIQS